MVSVWSRGGAIDARCTLAHNGNSKWVYCVTVYVWAYEAAAAAVADCQCRCRLMREPIHAVDRVLELPFYAGKNSMALLVLHFVVVVICRHFDLKYF